MAAGKLILAGGGSADDSRPLDERFAAWIKGGRLLYWPVAAEGDSETYAAAYDWIKSVFVPLGIKRIDMWTSFIEHSPHELHNYAGLYIGGGNTFRLLYLLRTFGFDRTILDYLNRGGCVYGGSAGAIVMGSDIMTCAHMDENKVALTDTRGLNLLDGYAVWAHYDTHEDSRIAQYIGRSGSLVIALSERGGLCLDGDAVRVCGSDPLYLFDLHGNKNTL